MSELVSPALQQKFADLLARQNKKGLAKYGRSLATDNGRDCTEDALEEWLDLGQYLMQAQLEAHRLRSLMAAMSIDYQALILERAALQKRVQELEGEKREEVS